MRLIIISLFILAHQAAASQLAMSTVSSKDTVSSLANTIHQKNLGLDRAGKNQDEIAIKSFSKALQDLEKEIKQLKQQLAFALVALQLHQLNPIDITTTFKPAPKEVFISETVFEY